MREAWAAGLATGLLAAAAAWLYWTGRARESNDEIARLRAGLKAGLADAVDEAWGKEESSHWMRDWCPGCAHMWESLELSGRCAWCCFGGPAHPDRPAFYEETELELEEGDDGY